MEAKMKRRESANEKMHQVFVALYPNCFCSKGSLKRPLKIGIFADIRREMPEARLPLLRQAIGSYVNGPRYQCQIIEGTPRVDLAGNIVGYVTKEQQEIAEKKWREREPSRTRSELSEWRT